jgi:hypothetical protein
MECQSCLATPGTLNSFGAGMAKEEIFAVAVQKKQKKA